MPYVAWVFLLVAMGGGILGFGLVAFSAAGIARAVFYIFLALFVVTIVRNAPRAEKTLPWNEQQ